MMKYDYDMTHVYQVGKPPGEQSAVLDLQLFKLIFV